MTINIQKIKKKRVEWSRFASVPKFVYEMSAGYITQNWDKSCLEKYLDYKGHENMNDPI